MDVVFSSQQSVCSMERFFFFAQHMLYVDLAINNGPSRKCIAFRSVNQIKLSALATTRTEQRFHRTIRFGMLKSVENIESYLR